MEQLFKVPRAITGLPPKFAAEIYSKLEFKVIWFASRPGGVCRKELQAKLGLSLYQTNKFIRFLRLQHLYTLGRTEFFIAPPDLKVHVEYEASPEGEEQRVKHEMERLEKRIQKLFNRWQFLRCVQITKQIRVEMAKKDPLKDRIEKLSQESMESILGLDSNIPEGAKSGW